MTGTNVPRARRGGMVCRKKNKGSAYNDAYRAHGKACAQYEHLHKHKSVLFWNDARESDGDHPPPKKHIRTLQHDPKHEMLIQTESVPWKPTGRIKNLQTMIDQLPDEDGKLPNKWIVEKPLKLDKEWSKPMLGATGDLDIIAWRQPLSKEELKEIGKEYIELPITRKQQRREDVHHYNYA